MLLYRKNRYLDELGIPRALYRGNFIREKKFYRWIQRYHYGFDYRDIFNMDVSFAEWLYSHMRMYKENSVHDDTMHSIVFEENEYTIKEAVDWIIEKTGEFLRYSYYIDAESDNKTKHPVFLKLICKYALASVKLYLGDYKWTEDNEYQIEEDYFKASRLFLEIMGEPGCVIFITQSGDEYIISQQGTDWHIVDIVRFFPDMYEVYRNKENGVKDEYGFRVVNNWKIVSAFAGVFLVRIDYFEKFYSKYQAQKEQYEEGGYKLDAPIECYNLFLQKYENIDVKVFDEVERFYSKYVCYHKAGDFVRSYKELEKAKDAVSIRNEWCGWGNVNKKNVYMLDYNQLKKQVEEDSQIFIF